MRCLIVLPTIDPEMTATLVESVHPSVYADLLVVDNCHRQLDALPTSVTVIRRRHNLGVAGSWNAGIDVARQRGYTHVMLVSANVKFGESGACDVQEQLERHDDLVFLPHPAYWHTAIFKIEFFDRVGLADENFYPAYYEDIDLIRRASLLGVHIEKRGQIDAVESRSGHGVDRLRHDFPGIHTINYDALARYWHDKWGCGIAEAGNVDAGYRTPFNSHASVDWWPPVPSIPDLRARYGIAGR